MNAIVDRDRVTILFNLVPAVECGSMGSCQQRLVVFTWFNLMSTEISVWQDNVKRRWKWRLTVTRIANFFLRFLVTCLSADTRKLETPSSGYLLVPSTAAYRRKIVIIEQHYEARQNTRCCCSCCIYTDNIERYQTGNKQIRRRIYSFDSNYVGARLSSFTLSLA